MTAPDDQARGPATPGPPPADEQASTPVTGPGIAESAAGAAEGVGARLAEAPEPARGPATDTALTAQARAGQAAGASSAAQRVEDSFNRRPEVFVGAAFAGGLLLAKILDAIGGDDDDQ